MKGALQKLALQELRQKGTRHKKPGEETRGKLSNIRLIDDRTEEVNARALFLVIGKRISPLAKITNQRSA